MHIDEQLEIAQNASPTSRLSGRKLSLVTQFLNLIGKLEFNVASLTMTAYLVKILQNFKPESFKVPHFPMKILLKVDNVYLSQACKFSCS